MNRNFLIGSQSMGGTIRLRRKAVGKSLKEVSEETGLSIAFLSQLERDISSPSLASLRMVAKALNASAQDFIGEMAEPSPVSRRVTRRHYAAAPTAPEYERLSDEFLGSTLSSVIIHVPSGYQSQLMTHEGEEIMYVLAGEIICEVNGEMQTLGEGDSIHFSSHVPHRTQNTSASTARVMWVGTFRIFDRGAGDTHTHLRQVQDMTNPLHFDVPEASEQASSIRTAAGK